MGIALAAMVLDKFPQGQVSSFTIGLSGTPILAALLGPPVFLVATWLWARRSNPVGPDRDRAT